MHEIVVFYKKELVSRHVFVEISEIQKKPWLGQKQEENRFFGNDERGGKMNQELLEIKSCTESGYHPQVYFEGWRVAFLNNTPKFHLEQIREMQRHNTSDEVFILLEGTVTLYIGDGDDYTPGQIRAVVLEPGKLYNVHKGVWHTHVTGPGSKVAIIENADVSSENSDTIAVDLMKIVEKRKLIEQEE